jgi:hypothetical protein
MPTLQRPSELIKCKGIVSCFQSIYNFLFAILIALAFLNFLYGAFLYLLSGAGIYKKEEGKNRMINSIVAVVIVLIIPIFLGMINPRIFNVKLKIPQIEVLEPPRYEYSYEPGKLPGTDIPVSPGQIKGNPNCSIPSSGYCSPSMLWALNMSNFSSDIINIFSIICQNESGGDPGKESYTDKCKDGNSFSIGLFQINMTTSWFNALDGTQCRPDLIFEGKDYSCRVKNPNLYEKCKNALKDPRINIDVAKRKYQSQGFGAWGVWPLIKQQCGL